MEETPEPGERRTGGPARLERPPSDRYARPGGEPAADAASGEAAGPVRGIVLGAIAGAAGSAVSILLFAIASISTGLLVVAAMSGFFVGQAFREGAGSTLPTGLRRTLAIATAIESVAVAQIGIWLIARSEGGALGLIDYLAQTFGPLVPLQVAIAAMVAWWAAR